MSWPSQSSDSVWPFLRRSRSSNWRRLASARALNTLSSSATMAGLYATIWLHVNGNFKCPFSGRIRYQGRMRIVETNEALAALVADLAQAPYLALDTEFLRDQTYYPKLCLLQVAAPGVEGIVDPLVPGLDLAPF